ncbi:MAG: hypothetical protein R6X14_02820 [bacterium]
MRVTAKIFMLVCTVFFLVCATNTSAQDAEGGWTAKKLQDMYMKYLAAEGYQPSIDSDGDVQFKSEGMTCFIMVQEQASDPHFFQILLPNFWDIESEQERQQVLAAADATNAKSKVAKVHTVGDWVCISAELFVNEPEDFKGVFDRAMRSLSNGLQNFVSRMRE